MQGWGAAFSTRKWQFLKNHAPLWNQSESGYGKISMYHRTTIKRLNIVFFQEPLSHHFPSKPLTFLFSRWECFRHCHTVPSQQPWGHILPCSEPTASKGRLGGFLWKHPKKIQKGTSYPEFCCCCSSDQHLLLFLRLGSAVYAWENAKHPESSRSNFQYYGQIENWVNWKNWGNMGTERLMPAELSVVSHWHFRLIKLPTDFFF